MPGYRAPGVFVEENGIRAESIEGVPISRSNRGSTELHRIPGPEWQRLLTDQVHALFRSDVLRQWRRALLRLESGGRYRRRLVAPGGAACGIYAHTDNPRGVWKAPPKAIHDFVPAHTMARGRAVGQKGRRSILRESRSQTKDRRRHRPRPTNDRGWHRPGTASRIRDLPHSPNDPRCVGITRTRGRRCRQDPYGDFRYEAETDGIATVRKLGRGNNYANVTVKRGIADATDFAN